MRTYYPYSTFHRNIDPDLPRFGEAIIPLFFLLINFIFFNHTIHLFKKKKTISASIEARFKLVPALQQANALPNELLPSPEIFFCSL